MASLAGDDKGLQEDRVSQNGANLDTQERINDLRGGRPSEQEPTDFVLSEGADGQQVWTNTKTGEIRTTVAPDGGVDLVAARQNMQAYIGEMSQRILQTVMSQDLSPPSTAAQPGAASGRTAVVVAPRSHPALPAAPAAGVSSAGAGTDNTGDIHTAEAASGPGCSDEAQVACVAVAAGTSQSAAELLAVGQRIPGAAAVMGGAGVGALASLRLNGAAKGNAASSTAAAATIAAAAAAGAAIAGCTATTGIPLEVAPSSLPVAVGLMPRVPAAFLHDPARIATAAAAAAAAAASVAARMPHLAMGDPEALPAAFRPKAAPRGVTVPPPLRKAATPVSSEPKPASNLPAAFARLRTAGGTTQPSPASQPATTVTSRVAATQPLDTLASTAAVAGPTTASLEASVLDSISAYQPGSVELEQLYSALALAAAGDAAAGFSASIVVDDPAAAAAVYAAAAEAQNAQLLQQAQFINQLRLEAQQSAIKAAEKDPSLFFGEAPSRFKGHFRPLRMCKHFITMGCWRGNDCTYAHSMDELHPASQDLPNLDLGIGELGAFADTSALAEQSKPPESQLPDVRMKKKRELCQKFQNNDCVLGRACPFAHGEAELGTVELVITEKVRTRICKFWTSGRCVFGHQCVNAHGEHEIGTKRPPFLTPPVKRRAAGETEEEFRNSVLARPSGLSAAG